MNRYLRAFGVFFVAAFGLWGCSRGPSANEETRIKALEAKNTRLEEDYKSASASREQLRKRLTATEETQIQLQQEIDRLRVAAKERDDFLAQLKSRTVERDQLQTQYESFRKNLRELLGQAEASLGRVNDLAAAPPGPALTPPAASSQALPAVAGAGTGPMLPNY